jgi:SpoVK/Ycf46/Vps4 family AAA+-type ATPase
MKPRNKVLLIALISQDYRDEASADIVHGKSDGLVILLHGGPGTGKTLTAESVAEHLGKPLYHVSLAEIGDDPHNAAKYLETVFYIGQTWGCILLLNDADRLFEERHLADMRRIAIVSTFMRMLDEYQGILILTTNYIHIFDEALRSRVQLALHFPPLGEDERRKIWYRFMHQLDQKGGSINEDELLDRLADFKFNGRQIRNVVGAAMRLARYQKVELDFSHFEAVIDVALHK